jgi:hypothetical protein
MLVTTHCQHRGETDGRELPAGRSRRAGTADLVPGGTGGLDHYAVAMKDPEGNEFDIN